MTDEDDDTWLDNRGNTHATCWQCGGEGYIDGECTCMDDCCCCLVPEPPVCDICKGVGSYIVKSANLSRKSA